MIRYTVAHRLLCAFDMVDLMPRARQDGRAQMRLLSLLFSAIVLFLLGSASAQQPVVLPHRPWLPGFGGLCDGGPLVCTRIDEMAFQAHADLVFSSSTPQRGLAFVTPYGLSFSLLSRLEFGVHSQTSVWTPLSSDVPTWQQGPLRFSVKGVLWPWRSNPHQQLALVASYEQDVRMWKFDGTNQLGLLSDLAALRISLNKPVGLAEIGLQAGLLFDWGGRFATVEVGARTGLHLPFLPEVKVFAEGAVRGLPKLSYVNPDKEIPGASDPANPLSLGAVLSFGVVTRPRQYMDFALAVSVGFGDVAPLAVMLRGPLDFSVGKGYPYPESLAIEILRDAAEWIAEKFHELPEPIRETCVLFGSDGNPIATLGTLSEDGKHCDFQGKRYRIGDKLYPDPVNRRVCVDEEASSCVSVNPPSRELMPTSDPHPSDSMTAPQVKPRQSLSQEEAEHLFRTQGGLGFVRGELDERCILSEGNAQVSPVGHREGNACVVERPVKDKKTGKTVRTEREEIPIGSPVFRDPQSGRICLRDGAKGNRHCPVVLDAEHDRALSDGQRAGYHGALGVADRAEEYRKSADSLKRVLTEPTELGTVAQRATESAQKAARTSIETLSDPAKAKVAAREVWESTTDKAASLLKSAEGWWSKPKEKKLDDLAEAGGGALLDLPVNMATGAIIGGAVKGERTLEAAEDALKSSQRSKHVLNAAEAVEKPPSLPVGRRGAPMEVPHGTNTPTTIDGRRYSGHALDQMQSRGFTPRVVENSIEHGKRAPGNQPGSAEHLFEGVKVITNDKGDVITVIPK